MARALAVQPEVLLADEPTSNLDQQASRALLSLLHDIQSYVPQWPGVMCIYGVTQVGAGSMGASRFLPLLVQALEVTKPLLVFLGGAWLVLYLINRRTRTAPLMNRVLLALLAIGLFAAADSAVETAYLVVPKKEEFLSAGCARQLWMWVGAPCDFCRKPWDEVSGREVDSALTYFVRSPVITTATTGNRIHVFQNKSDAEQHARAFKGRLLRDSERPLRQERAGTDS